MKSGNTDEELNIEDIDKAIKDFILTLNSYKGIETSGCCSGHPQDGKARYYIYFVDNKVLI